MPSASEANRMPIALVTGSGSLIGDGIARALAAAGWQLALTDLNPQLARNVADGIPASAVRCAEKMDVTDSAEIARVVGTLTNGGGGIDALVNVAGGGRGLGVPMVNFVEVTPAQRDKLLEVNVKGLFNVTHAVLTHMLAARRGNIVSIAASRGLKGGPQAAVYSACKAAIVVFSQSLAQEVGPHGIRVNTVAPGDTPARWKAPTPQPGSPLGTVTSPDDIGNAVEFLLSERSSHITGSCLDLSGGVALH
jgi:3-oxoacyl-[acyl-carrier protein] reductase